jgi:hypothetical protein
MEPLRCAMGQAHVDELTATNRRPIPEGHEAAGHLAQQMSYNTDPVVRIERVPLAMGIQLAPGARMAPVMRTLTRRHTGFENTRGKTAMTLIEVVGRESIVIL